jgi:pimeloyl-ACP methyl ester carboxylesterase
MDAGGVTQGGAVGVVNEAGPTVYAARGRCRARAEGQNRTARQRRRTTDAATRTWHALSGNSVLRVPRRPGGWGRDGGGPCSLARTEDGASIAYRTLGSGPRNVVFLHPWGGSGSYFDETIASLDLAAVRAITLDFRGHGDSDKPDAELTLDLVAGDVLAVAAAAADVFVAVGHGMGGKFAQYLPLVAPSRIAGLVLVQTAPAGHLPTPDFVAEWVTLAGDAQAILHKAVTPYLHRPVPEYVLRRFAQNWTKIPRAYLERTLRLVESSFRERVRAVRAPVLVVAGARDPNHSAMTNDVVALLPHAHLETLDRGAEIPMKMPSKLAHLIQQFVADLP